MQMKTMSMIRSLGVMLGVHLEWRGAPSSYRAGDLAGVKLARRGIKK